MKVRITSDFWKRYQDIVRENMLPYQWDVLNDRADIRIEGERRNDDSIPTGKSHAFENFRIAAGKKEGRFYGMVFQDSDAYKWLEAAAYSLRNHPDKELQAKADALVDLIGDAQEADGYLDTYFTIEAPEHKYKRLMESHELYCGGHFLEAAVAYYEATGHEKVLSIARKLADQICLKFGPEPGKIHGYDGHEEIEIGLLRLYHLTGDASYLEMARYFLLERGKNPDFFKKQLKEDDLPAIFPDMGKLPDSYFQNDMPFLEADQARGHAVRMLYQCTAMADLALISGNEEVKKACERIWDNITEQQMYITGGTGQTAIGESFTGDYDLPTDSMYCETCAAVGMITFARQMLCLTGQAKYADIMERVLYNGLISGMDLEGKHFFYVNPLEVHPQTDPLDPGKNHVKAVRPSWLGCACCPPNLARLLASLEQYIYLKRDGNFLINLFISSEWTGSDFHIVQKSDYPWDGSVSILVENRGEAFSLGVRIPSWCDHWKLSGKFEVRDGYAWVLCPSGETKIDFTMDMQAVRVYANDKVSACAGKAAVMRGPLVYCMEGVDNGREISNLVLPVKAEFTENYRPDLLNGILTLHADGIRETSETKELYSHRKKQKTPASLTFIPYYAWANRGENEMQVWIREEN